MCIENMRKEIFMVVAGHILLITSILLARPCTIADSKDEHCCLTFNGKASGGTLIMWDNLGRNARYISIETIAGESAETSIKRLADAIEEKNPFDWIIVRGGRNEIGARIVTSSGGELMGLVGGCGDYMLAGTETGLGIPRPPHSLTANYDPNLKKITFKWINPPDGYDSIRVRFNWSNYDHTGGDGIVGSGEIYDINLSQIPVDMGDLDFLVIGVRNDIPSSAAAIHIKNNIQEELFGIPFTGGLAPNWQSWSLDANENKTVSEMGIRNEFSNAKDRRYNPVTKAEAKPFYQIISTGNKVGTGGVYRKFIGLTPGHTYRVKTRVAILSEPNEGQWSFSVHAATNEPDGLDISARQMAGLDNLPSGIKGNTAGRMALFDSSLETKGRFVEISTDKAIQGKEISDVTLPQGVDSITIWLRSTSSKSSSVAIDWIGLEDLSMQKI